jgi:hypothetical protein
MVARHRNARIRDFRDRARRDPNGPLVHPVGVGESVTLHPFSDDHCLVGKLGMSPSDCLGVDAYWLIHGDVVFVRVHGSEAGWHLGVGLHARIDDRRGRRVRGGSLSVAR